VDWLRSTWPSVTALQILFLKRLLMSNNHTVSKKWARRLITNHRWCTTSFCVLRSEILCLYISWIDRGPIRNGFLRLLSYLLVVITLCHKLCIRRKFCCNYFLKLGRLIFFVDRIKVRGCIELGDLFRVNTVWQCKANTFNIIILQFHYTLAFLRRLRICL